MPIRSISSIAHFDALARRRLFIAEKAQSLRVTIAILLSLLFLYAAAIPLGFAAPDFATRIRGVFLWTWDAEQLLDLKWNILGFVPIGYCWAAALHSLGGPRTSRLRSVRRAAWMCLFLATISESVQWWLPLRDPSLRDVLALEAGGVAGAVLWMALGSWSDALSLSVNWALYAIGGRSVFRLVWPAFFVAVFLGCLTLNCYASPLQLFLMYRFRELSLHDIARRLNDFQIEHTSGAWDELFPSLIAAILVVGACKILPGLVTSVITRHRAVQIAP